MEATRINGYSELKEDKACYFKTDNGWLFYHPKGGLGNLKAHDVVEHEDGTISVSPSILITGHDSKVHGFLKKGIWTDC